MGGQAGGHELSGDAKDPEIRRQISAALVATRRYGPGYQIIRQAVSGSRVNFLLEVDDAASSQAATVWCRATHRSIDDAFRQRFTLAREASLLREVANRTIAVPDLFAMSPDGHVLIQRAIDEVFDADDAARATHIQRYLTELDRVHALPADEILPAAEIPHAFTATEAVHVEQGAWLALADELAATPTSIAAIERGTGMDRVGERLQRIHSCLAALPVPPLAPELDFVHGDAGRANYLVDRAGQVWLIDWELAHAGSRLEDYAWIELRGLEQDEAEWRNAVVGRLTHGGAGLVNAYRYFRTSVYFRSVIAIAARIAAEPEHAFVPYLCHRFAENEQLGWLSAGAHPATGTALRGPRFDAWQRWTTSLERAQRLS